MVSQGSGVLVLSLVLLSLAIGSFCLLENGELRDFSTQVGNAASPIPKATEDKGKRWAVLIAGSNEYYNYRHQADICHAYQILKKGGLEDENIIVFMYDDIAYNKDNPKQGVIINKPNGHDVYKGVPKDYIGDAVTADNFYAVLLGNKSALTGGSGKVLKSGPNDRVFIYYADHGGTGILAMPNDSDYVYAKDLIHVLNKMHASKSFKSLVFYIEACESGSMFEGILPKNINIYSTTAANANESSYGTYCPGDPRVPAEFNTCLGDLYSISWMEDCDRNDLRKETLEKQYQTVKRRTNESHVMQYGDMSHRKEFLYAYMGADLSHHTYPSTGDISPPSITKAVHQRDTKLLHLQYKFRKAPAGSQEKSEARKKLNDEIAHRKLVDYRINIIGDLLLGHEKSKNVLMNVKSMGQPAVNDWDCFKKLLKIYEKYCGHLSEYGMKYTRAIANICDAGVTDEEMVEVSSQVCSEKPRL